MTTQLDYYSYKKLDSYNATYNFVIGGRGLGKTYGAKLKILKSAIKDGEEFIYLRRYKPEIQASKESFFADLEHEFPEYDFRVTGHVAQYARVETRDDKNRVWVTMGYFFALSVAQSLKSVSFHKVTKIVFDEFIIEKGNLQYLNNEAISFNNFYSTVDRWKDKTKVYFLANSVSIMNPYFLEYDIRPEQVGEYTRFYNGFMLVHFADSTKFRQQVSTTRFGKFIENSDYAKYAVGNEFSDNNAQLIGKKTPGAVYLMTIETKYGTFSVWVDMGASPTQYFVQSRQPKQQIKVVLDPALMGEEKRLLSFSDGLLSQLRTAFRQGYVYFDKPSNRNAFIEIFKR